MKDNLTEIVFILDRSGSMSSIKNDVIGNFNEFILQQRKLPGEARVTTVLFDDVITELYKNVDIKEVETLTDKTFVPRGMTALLDAVGSTINSLGLSLANMDESERPGKVMVVIVTDGEENASREFTRQQIKQMIEHQESVYSWDFIFIAANMDAALVGNTVGIKGNKTMNFGATSKGVASMSASLNSYTTSYRSASKGFASNLDIKDFENK